VLPRVRSFAVSYIGFRTTRTMSCNSTGW
jgi:hypothetical protein